MVELKRIFKKKLRLKKKTRKIKISTSEVSHANQVKDLERNKITQHKLHNQLKTHQLQRNINLLRCIIEEVMMVFSHIL